MLLSLGATFFAAGLAVLSPAPLHATAQLQNLAVSPSCFTPGSVITVSYQIRAAAFQGMSTDVVFSTNDATRQWSDDAFVTSAGLLSTPNTGGHDGYGVGSQEGTGTVWTNMSWAIIVPAGYSAYSSFTLFVGAHENGLQLYSWGGTSDTVLSMTVNQCPSGSPTNSPTATNSPTSSPTFSVSPTPSNSPLPTNTYTASPTRTPSPTPSNTPLGTNTFTVSPTISPTFTFSVSPTNSPTRTVSPTPSITRTNTPAYSATVTPTFSVTPPYTPTNTPTPIVVPMVKSVGVASATIGDTVTYCIAWQNNSGGSYNVVIWDTLSIALTFVGANNGGTYSPRMVVWNLGSQGAGASGSVCFWGVVSGYPFVPGRNLVAWLQSSFGPPWAADLGEELQP